MRRRLPAAVKMYTGDDFNYPDLIAGDAQGFSHALLGIFDAIAPAASAALAALAEGDLQALYDRLMAPTVPLSRLIFRAPTQYYKTGIVFLAWLNGHQDHFIMVAGAQAMRPLPYFTEMLQAGRPGRPPARSRARGEAHEASCWRSTASRCVMLASIPNSAPSTPRRWASRRPIERRHRRRGARRFRRHRALAARSRRPGCRSHRAAHPRCRTEGLRLLPQHLHPGGRRARTSSQYRGQPAAPSTMPRCSGRRAS